MPAMACDHFDGTRTYEGNWGQRSVRFCAESHLPTIREQVDAEFETIIENDEPRRTMRLSGDPARPISEVVQPR